MRSHIAAHQAGALSIDAHSIEEAIRQTGISVEMSVPAFRWGRMSVIDPAFVRAEVNRHAGTLMPALSPLGDEARQIVESIGVTGELHRLVTVRVAELIAYQDAAYARRYAEAVRRTFLTEQRKVPAKTEYSHAVARFLLKLMAYKDEFEVARLHYAVAVQIAKIPDDIRGYGHVKMQSLQLAEQKEGKLLEEYFSRVSERSAA